uniref:Uncharacterized protein n=1 Tax=Oryza punctata TaxID=4537 RepID=A0A0E0JTI8_ORYPU
MARGEVRLPRAWQRVRWERVAEELHPRASSPFPSTPRLGVPSTWPKRQAGGAARSVTRESAALSSLAMDGGRGRPLSGRCPWSRVVQMEMAMVCCRVANDAGWRHKEAATAVRLLVCRPITLLSMELLPSYGQIPVLAVGSSGRGWRSGLQHSIATL